MNRAPASGAARRRCALLLVLLPVAVVCLAALVVGSGAAPPVGDDLVLPDDGQELAPDVTVVVIVTRASTSAHHLRHCIEALARCERGGHRVELLLLDGEPPLEAAAGGRSHHHTPPHGRHPHHWQQQQQQHSNFFSKDAAMQWVFEHLRSTTVADSFAGGVRYLSALRVAALRAQQRALHTEKQMPPTESDSRLEQDVCELEADIEQHAECIVVDTVTSSTSSTATESRSDSAARSDREHSLPSAHQQQQQLQPPVATHAALMNVAAAYARAPAVLFLSMFVEVERHFLVPLMDELRATESLGAVGCRVASPGGLVQDAGIEFLMGSLGDQAPPSSAFPTGSRDDDGADAEPRASPADLEPPPRRLPSISLPYHAVDVPLPAFRWQGETLLFADAAAAKDNDDGAADVQAALEALSGMCLLTWRHAWERVGGFDEGFTSTPGSGSWAVMHTHLAVIDYTLELRRQGLLLALAHRASGTFNDPHFDSPPALIDAILTPWRRDDAKPLISDKELADVRHFAARWGLYMTEQQHERYALASLALVWDMECGLGQGTYKSERMSE